MKTRFRPACIAALVLAVILSFPVCASAATEYDAEPYLINFAFLKASLSISESGRSNTEAKACLRDDTLHVNLESSLQRLENGRWVDVKSWSTTGSTVVTLTEQWYVTSGYSYRVVATAKVYDGNTLIETANRTSATVTY